MKLQPSPVAVGLGFPMPALPRVYLAGPMTGFPRYNEHLFVGAAAWLRGQGFTVWSPLERRWRALLLVTKAKFEAVASGISTVEREFLADLVLPNGRVVQEELAPRLARWRETEVAVPLIPERGT